MRTLVVSDLHLGAQTRVDLLRRAELRGPLLEAAARADRVVLLGDLLELRQTPLHRALEVARPFLSELREALGDGELAIVPGNHDHGLAAPALARRRASGAPLGLAEELAVEPGDPLAGLAGGPLSLSYPGVWLRDDVYATHGQLLDCHLTVPTLERLAVGLIMRFAGGIPERPVPADYEAVLAPLYDFGESLAAHANGSAASSAQGVSARIWRSLAGEGAHRTVRRRVLAGAFPLAVYGLNRAGLGALRPDISGAELRRAGLRAIAEVARRLRIDAAHLVFGHTHRAGPLPGDDPREWAPAAGPALVNSGSWVYEPSLLGARARPGAPYWPGTAVQVAEQGPPRVVELLGSLDRAALAGR